MDVIGMNACSKANPKFFLHFLTSEIHRDILRDIEDISITPSQYQKIKQLMEEMFFSSENWVQSALRVVPEHHPCLSNMDAEIIGSISEGLSLAEVSEVGKNEEVDMTLVVKSIHASDQPEYYYQENFVEIQYSKEFPGYGLLKVNNANTASTWNGFCNILSSSDGKVNEFYLSPVAVTDEFYLMMCYKYGVQNLEYILKCKNIEKLEVPLDDLTSASTNAVKNEEVMFYLAKQEGPAVKTTVVGSNKFSFQFDCCIAIPCSYWPPIIEKFKERMQRSDWFTNVMIEKITSTSCLLVPKSPTNTKCNLEWRLSFCLAEREIMQNLTDIQRKCYLIVKAVWRKFLNPSYGKGLQSYHLKNILLWECEEVPKCGWVNELLIIRVIGIFQRLHKYLVDGYLPHYILPSNNLFKDIETNVLFRTAQRVQSCIFQSPQIWIENDTLLFLAPLNTRKAMDNNLRRMCFDSITDVIQGMVSNAGEMGDLENFRFVDKIIWNRLHSSLKKVIGTEIANLVLKCINSNALTENNIRRYLYSKASPKQLLKAAKSGLLYGVSILISIIVAWAEMIDFVTKMNILFKEDFTQYGFSNTYHLKESTSLLHQFYETLGHENTNELIPADIHEQMFDQDLDMSDEEMLGFVCDACDMPIQDNEVRYHCGTCEDFDLCSKCYEMNTNHTHDFFQMQ